MNYLFSRFLKLSRFNGGALTKPAWHATMASLTTKSDSTNKSNPSTGQQSNSSQNKPETSRINQSTGDLEKSQPRAIPSKEELKARLSPIQFQVTQCKSTERPFSGEYNKNYKKGSYHCIVCDELLFESDTKFDSGCGWPAFWDCVDKSKIKFVKDYALVGANILLLAKNPNLVRTEVLCKNCDAHLGHVFDDGPAPTRKRYCINSASLKFVVGGENN